MGTSEMETAVTFALPGRECLSDWRDELSLLLKLLLENLERLGFAYVTSRVSSLRYGSLKCTSSSGKKFVLLLLWPLEHAPCSGQIRVRYVRPCPLRLMGNAWISGDVRLGMEGVRSAIVQCLAELNASNIEWTTERAAELKLRGG